MYSNKKNLIKTFVFSFVGFGIGYFIYLIITTNDIFRSIILALLAGLLFSVLISAFCYFNEKRMQNVIPKDVNLIYQGSANCVVGMESVGGYMYLTESFLCFVSHKYNINKMNTKILLSEIDRIETGNIKNSFHIICGNTKHVFIVFNRDVWIENITRLIERVEEK